MNGLTLAVTAWSVTFLAWLLGDVVRQAWAMFQAKYFPVPKLTIEYEDGRAVVRHGKVEARVG